MLDGRVVSTVTHKRALGAERGLEARLVAMPAGWYPTYMFSGLDSCS